MIRFFTLYIILQQNIDFGIATYGIVMQCNSSHLETVIRTSKCCEKTDVLKLNNK